MTKYNNIKNTAFKVTTKLQCDIANLKTTANLLSFIRQRGNTTALKTIDNNVIVFSSEKISRDSNATNFISLKNSEKAIRNFEGSNKTVNFDNSAVNSIVHESIESLETSESFINEQNKCIVNLSNNIEIYYELFHSDISNLNRNVMQAEMQLKSLKWWQLYKASKVRKSILIHILAIKTISAENYRNIHALKHITNNILYTIK